MLDTLPIETGSKAVAKGKQRLLTRAALDGRTRARKSFDALVNGIHSDLGGRDRLSTIELALVEAFAGASVHVEDLNARLLLGQRVDLAEHAAAISTMVRVASRLGTRRRTRDVTLSLSDYLQASAQEVDADAAIDDAEAVV